jgi:hypothetical protein
VGIETITEQAPLNTVSAATDGNILTLASTRVTAGTLEVLIEESPDEKPLVRTNFRPEKA